MHTHNVAQVRLWQSLVVLTSFVPREEGGAAVDAVLLQLNGEAEERGGAGGGPAGGGACLRHGRQGS